MPSVRQVPASDVPKPARTPAERRKREYDRYISELDSSGKLASEFQLAEDEPARKVMARLRWAARRAGILNSVEIWEADGVVYAQRK